MAVVRNTDTTEIIEIERPAALHRGHGSWQVANLQSLPGTVVLGKLSQAMHRSEGKGHGVNRSTQSLERLIACLVDMTKLYESAACNYGNIYSPASTRV